MSESAILAHLDCVLFSSLAVCPWQVSNFTYSDWPALQLQTAADAVFHQIVNNPSLPCHAPNKRQLAALYEMELLE